MKKYDKNCYSQIRQGEKINMGKEIERIFQDKTLKDKYILWVFPQIYVPFPCEITGDIKLIKNGGELEIPTYKLRKPFVNKRLNLICLRKGRKITKGIPFFFDTFEELSEVKELEISWDIENIGDILIHYQLSFEKIKGEKVYTAYSGDITLMGECDQQIEYQNQFDNIYNIKIDKGSFLVVPIKEKRIKNEDKNMMGLIMKCMNKKTMTRLVETNNFLVLRYEKTLELVPDIFIYNHMF